MGEVMLHELAYSSAVSGEGEAFVTTIHRMMGEYQVTSM